METIKLRVEGMTCGHCQASVTNALKSVPGVTAANVDLSAKMATVTYTPGQASLATMKAAVEEEGYVVTGPV